MNASSNSTASTSSTSLDDQARGYTIVHRAIDILGWGIAIACAWSCSSLIVGTIMLIVMGFFMALIAYAAKLMVMLNVEPTKVETLGRIANPSRITNLFKRTPAPAATN